MTQRDLCFVFSSIFHLRVVSICSQLVFDYLNNHFRGAGGEDKQCATHRHHHHYHQAQPHIRVSLIMEKSHRPVVSQTIFAQFHLLTSHDRAICSHPFSARLKHAANMQVTQAFLVV